tara:strand:+ start:753 stop:1694 length:942 start_codon:yes stop_codon:yes gene_type:complete
MIKKKIKKALILGISGQDGTHISDCLLKQNIEVHGVSRKKSNWSNNLKSKNILKKVKVFRLRKNLSNLIRILRKNYDYIFFFGAQNNVFKSFNKLEKNTFESHIKPLQIILEYIRKQKSFKSKLLFASSSEIFGYHANKKLNEKSEKNPLSPYGLSKLIGLEIVKSYREMFSLPVFSIIFFNHESNIRSNEFVFKKVSNYLKKGNFKKKLALGDTSVKRDWGWSVEYMNISVKIMQSKYVDDYIIATGKTIELKNIIKLFFKKHRKDYKKYTKIDKKFYRKNEIKENYADIKKIKRDLKIYPKIKYNKLINFI